MRRLLAALVLLAAPAAYADHTVRCLVRSGHAGVHCLAAYTGAIERCRRTADVACETALRAPGGTLDRVVAQADEASRAPCTTADADALGYVGGLSDLGLRTRQACGDFAEDLLSIGYAAGSGASTGPLLRCQRAVAARLRRLRGRVIAAFGPGCFVPVLAGRGCARGRRDHRVALARADARRELLRAELLRRRAEGRPRRARAPGAGEAHPRRRDHVVPDAAGCRGLRRSVGQRLAPVRSL